MDNHPTFHTPLTLTYVDGRMWRLAEAFTYESTVHGDRCLTVPADFLTDFASIPRFFWRLLPPIGIYGKAAVIHDYLYHTPGLFWLTRMQLKGNPGQICRRYADDIFFEAMGVLGVGWLTRHTLYWAVRRFGGAAYKGTSR